MNALTPQAMLSEPWPYLGSTEERAALFRKDQLSAALGYVAKGYSVFPAMMIGGQKKPLVKWGKGEDGHPDLTKRRATTAPEKVKAWWARWPLAMIGMPTGKLSGAEQRGAQAWPQGRVGISASG